MTTALDRHPEPTASRAQRRWPGLALATTGVAVAAAVNLAVPALSALTVAVVLGVLVGNLPVLPSATEPGLRWATRRLLRLGVVLLGLQLAVGHVLDLGAGTVVAVTLTVLITFVGTLLLGRLLRLPRGLTTLVATGFSICGASAIAAMESVVKRRDEDVTTAIALVTVYGGLAIVAVPTLGPLLGLTGVDLGAWAGLSVHEVAQVVAAASPAGAAAIAMAAVVKLSRVVLLAPMVASMSVLERRGARPEDGPRPPLVPLFVVGFLAMVAVRSTGVAPEAVLDVSKTVTTLLLAGALFGLGCAVKVRSLLATGPRALLLGLGSTLLVASVAYATLRLLA